MTLYFICQVILLPGIIDLLSGTRDTPKYHIVLMNYALRKRALIEGRRLVHEGRLDAAEDVFDLTFGDLESAVLDPFERCGRINCRLNLSIGSDITDEADW